MPRKPEPRQPPEGKKVMNVHEAKTHFSHILARVEGGEEITISRDGREVARIVPVRAPRILGAERHLLESGAIWIPDNFDDPMSDEDVFGPGIHDDPFSPGSEE